jgi:SAM-dependent methyltransferase
MAQAEPERSNLLYRVLEIPAVYRLAQFMLAPGYERPFVGAIREVAAELPPATRVLDVGCGPQSWLWQLGLLPVGIDPQPSYTKALCAAGSPAVIGSALALPFRDAAFDAVWCFGVLHHLTDDGARTALAEMQRVCRLGGYVVAWDIVLPELALRRPIAWTIRKLDRGGQVRSRAALRALLPEAKRWQIRELRYTVYGLEGCFCVRQRSERS